MVPNRCTDLFNKQTKWNPDTQKMWNPNKSNIVLIIKHKHKIDVYIVMSWHSIIKMGESYHWCFP